ncbi:hypothetical protein BX666DRAFT_595908 [Dichotomocladium elegans]|nr:hypothetical protein BX666DRAFT_595908 [Dichotomocladium elegans]
MFIGARANRSAYYTHKLPCWTANAIYLIEIKVLWKAILLESLNRKRLSIGKDPRFGKGGEFSSIVLQMIMREHPIPDPSLARPRYYKFRKRGNQQEKKPLFILAP